MLKLGSTKNAPKTRTISTKVIQKAKFSEAWRNARGCRGGTKGGVTELGTEFERKLEGEFGKTFEKGILQNLALVSDAPCFPTRGAADSDAARAFRRAINLFISLGLLSFRDGDGVDINFDTLASEGPADLNISKTF